MVHDQLESFMEGMKVNCETQNVAALMRRDALQGFLNSETWQTLSTQSLCEDVLSEVSEPFLLISIYSNGKVWYIDHL